MALFKRKKKTLEEQLAEARSKIAELEGSVTQGSTRDQLTSMLLTLRAFRAQLDLDVERAQRYKRPLAIAVIDIDGFRRINEDHGYETGDMILVAVGELIAERSRTNDLACRISGDEFALLFPETEARDAVPALERTIAEIEQLETPAGALSISAGITMLEPEQTSGDLLSVARSALERARAQGGGCVFADTGSAPVASRANELVGAAAGSSERSAGTPAGSGAAVAAPATPTGPGTSDGGESSSGPPGSGDPDPAAGEAEPDSAAEPTANGADPAHDGPAANGSAPHSGQAQAGPGPQPAGGPGDPGHGVAAEPTAAAPQDVPPIAESAIEVGRELEVPEDQLGLLHRAALMRVGPQALPQDMIDYLQSVNPAALEAMSADPPEAGSQLEAAGGLDFEAAAIGRMAERWDGRGAPDGLAGEQIPIAARILAVCEAFESMTVPEPVGQGLPRNDAVTEIARGSGSRFDPKVVDAFISYVYRRARSGR